MRKRTRSIVGQARALAIGVAFALLGTLLAPWVPTRAAHAVASPPPSLHVQDNQLVDSAGSPIILRGVNRSGTEYQCVHGVGIFDPTSLDSMDQVQTDDWIRPITTWNKINAVRVPLNEDCWLGINRVPAAYAGINYQNAIKRFVTGLKDNGLVAILDLHWSAPGKRLAKGQQPMPDADHSILFWQQVAATFKDDQSVVFDLFNEPYPNSNTDTTAAWQCWELATNCSGVHFKAAGMQDLVEAVRGPEVDAHNVIMLGGVQYANTLSRWLTYRPADNNLVASWHIYDFNLCNTRSCWDTNVAPVAQQVPVVTGEFAEQNQGPNFVYCTANCPATTGEGLLPWLNGNGIGYVGWTWDLWDKWDALITNTYANPIPNRNTYNGTQAYGGAYHDYLASLGQTP